MFDKIGKIPYNWGKSNEFKFNPIRNLSVRSAMNGNGTLTAALSVGVTPDLKRRLQVLARQQHRSLSSAVRVLLEEAMELEASLTPVDPKRSEYEIKLTVKQAARMVRQGYDVQIWEPQYTQMPLL